MPQFAVALEFSLAFGLAAASVVSQRVIRVPADQPTIQRALIASTHGDTILVAPGSYRENLTFGGKNVHLTSEAGSQFTFLVGDQTTSVVTFAAGELRTAVLEGFTIRNGAAMEGGGVFVSAATPTIRNNIIVDNTCCTAGGGIGVGFGSPRIEGNLIRDNRQSGCVGGFGGGISVRGPSNTEIVDNVITNNTYLSGGGGISLFGAGSARVERNVIRDNVGGQGGAIYAVNQSDALIDNNLMVGNRAFGGAAIYSFSALRVINNTIVGNNGSPAIDVFPPSGIVFRNNIIVTPVGGTGVTCQFGSMIDFRHNNVWAPSGLAYGGACPDLTGRDGNIAVDPQFLGNGDYRLARTSPCVDTGENGAPALPTRDYDGDPRPLDGDLDSRAIVDMGFDEQSGVRGYGGPCRGSGNQSAAIGYAGGTPAPGNASFSITVRRALGGADAVLLVGESRERWQLGALPYDLQMFGMPGCSLWVSLRECIYARLTGSGAGNGSGAVNLAVPNDASVRGAVLYAQWLVADPGPGFLPGASSGALFVEIL